LKKRKLCATRYRLPQLISIAEDVILSTLASRHWRSKQASVRDISPVLDSSQIAPLYWDGHPVKANSFDPLGPNQQIRLSINWKKVGKGGLL
jgi:hypothetical protein